MATVASNSAPVEASAANAAASEPNGAASAPASSQRVAEASASEAPLTLSLGEAFERLEAENLDLALAEVRLDQAAAITREAGAELRPNLVATGSYVRNNDEVSLRVGDLLAQLPGAPVMPNVVIQPLDAWSATGTLRVPLFVPTGWHNVKAAEANETSTKGQIDLARAQARSALASLAYGALALEEVVAAAERAIELAAQQAESAERRVQAGTAAPLDVLRAQAERVRRESDLARARADLERTRLSIGVLLGQAVVVRVTAPAETSDVVDTTSSAQALEQRPEFRVLEARAQAGEALLSSANARFLPQLHASGSVFASDEPYPTGDKTGWRVGVELTVPLYDGGLRYGKRDEAHAVVRAARLESAQKRLVVQQEVANAEREIAVAVERLRLAETRVRLARDAAASAQRSFVAGIASALDVLDANDKLFQAEVALATERAHKAQAKIELKRALGTL
jgi:outer membrane protein TolC